MARAKMSAFEFVLISFAIVIGLGISEVVSGWGDQVRFRHRLRIYPLQVAASAFVLYLSLQYLWLLWMFRNFDWTFPRYLGVAGPALALALAARVCRVDTSRDASAVRDQYFRASPAFFSLLAAFPILIAFMSFTSGMREGVPNPPNLAAVSTVRLGLAALYFTVAWSKSERYHWFGVALMWLAAVGFLIRFGARIA